METDTNDHRKIHELAKQIAIDNASRYTPTKRKIIEFLRISPYPQSVTEIRRSLKGLPLSSLYRNIESMVVWGLITRVVTTTDISRFELAEIATGSHHHHLVCSKCGSVRDVSLPSSIESGLDSQLATIAAREGFVFKHHQLDVIGLCGRCA